MLQIKHICKQYKTGSLIQLALDDVSLNLRNNEFISILGPSGSGKTTLLNIIGGLDQYDNGDLIIDGISTKQYNARAWDSYRSHTIGFVFQSYNLIPHQSVLANVELALTISGFSRKERKGKAKQALIDVGLEDHMHKRPNQLSGGQMQRVAIARALVNDPKILLADEPTGALDTETGHQVMAILKKVAENRLVIMVTHNPELAQQYSSRIVKLCDGKVTADSDPFVMEDNQPDAAPDKKIKAPKSRMSFFTSLALSFQNLRSKTARTIITAAAGSIGIVGIALILAMSNGVNQYINRLQRETIESYPITIDAQTFNFDYKELEYSGEAEPIPASDNDDKSAEGKIKISVPDSITSSQYETPVIKKNNLSAFKEYLEKPENQVDTLIGSGAVIPQYNTRFGAYTTDKNQHLVNTSSYIDSNGTVSPAYGDYTQGFTCLPQGRDDAIISKKTKDSYHLIYGKWPEAEDECVIITRDDGTMDAQTMFQLGYLSADDYVKLTEHPETADSSQTGSLSYKEICQKQFSILPVSYRYEKQKNGLYRYISDSSAAISQIIRDHGIQLKVTGIISPVEQTNSAAISPFNFSDQNEYCVGYTHKLVNRIIDSAAQTAVVKEQLRQKNKSVLSGLSFDVTKVKEKADHYAQILLEMDDLEKINLLATYIGTGEIDGAVGSSTGENPFTPSVFDKWLDHASDTAVCELFENALEIPDNLENTLYTIGYVSYEEPTAITIYTDTFEGKQGILSLLDQYNAQASEKDQITYVDYIQELTTQLSDIINTVSYVLIAFVAVSLIVSCIMIGIITHISVLERTKEIGILRALGASKRNIFQVFNAETFIIGLLSGLIGILFAGLLCIPANIIISSMQIVTDSDFSISLPILPCVMLVIISTFMTMLGGFIPANSASRKDPVIALRSE